MREKPRDIKQTIKLVEDFGRGKIVKMLRNLDKSVGLQHSYKQSKERLLKPRTVAKSEDIAKFLALALAIDEIEKEPQKKIDIREDLSQKKLMQPKGWETQVLKQGDCEVGDKIVLVEIKGDDFLDSIFDKRLFQQVDEIVKVGQKPVLATYKEMSDLLRDAEKRNIPHNVVYGTLVSLIDRGVSLVMCPNRFILSIMIDRLAEKVLDDKDREVNNHIREGKRRKFRKDRVMFCLTSHRGIGEVRATELLDTYGSLEEIYRICLDRDKEEIEEMPMGKYLLNIRATLKQRT